MVPSNPAFPAWRQRLSAAANDIEKLLEQLTLEEKVALCHAGGKFRNHGVERLGIPAMVMSDASHGIRRELQEHGWDPVERDDDYTTYLPTGTCLASTWNPELAREFGEVLGRETRARRKDVILGPGINIIRNPLCGRNFEYYSEDPYLVAKIAPAVITGTQAGDVAACVKHYALNSQDWNRHHVDARPNERTLREIYLPGFEAAIQEGGCLTIMGAYNKYNGQWCCHNEELLKRILKEEWGFEGLVVSDWDGTHVSDEAALNGLDIEMGTGTESYEDYHLANPFLAGLKSGKFPMAELDDKVRRILRVIFSIGLMEPNTRIKGAQHPPEHCAAARRFAEEGVVLLQNEGMLPLDHTRIRKLAVIGENATMLHAAGGGSSGVKALYEISPLRGLREKLGDSVEIVHCQGYPEATRDLPQIPDHCLATVDEGSGIKGWRVEWNNFHQFEGETLAVEFREQVKLDYPEDTIVVVGQRRNYWATRWSARLTAPETGNYTFALNSEFWARFKIDGGEVIAFERNADRTHHTVRVDLEQGRQYALTIEYGHADGDAYLQFGWFLPGETIPASSQRLDEAVAAALDADAVLVCGGLNHFHDNEGSDRKQFNLPGGQDELIEAVAAVNPNIVVLMIAGSPAAMPWADKVKSILWTGYAGMESGRVFADILFGDVNPSGKLSYTLAHKLEDYPGHALGDYNKDVCHYREGVFVGYRWFGARGIEPHFCFGHGLSYTTFELSDIEVETVVGEGTLSVTANIRNTRTCAGKEVVQLYIEDIAASVERPRLELKGFRKVALEPGASTAVRFRLTDRDLSFWDESVRAWKREAGEFIAHVGTSSHNLQLRSNFTIS